MEKTFGGLLLMFVLAIVGLRVKCLYNVIQIRKTIKRIRKDLDSENEREWDIILMLNKIEELTVPFYTYFCIVLGIMVFFFVIFKMS